MAPRDDSVSNDDISEASTCEADSQAGGTDSRQAGDTLRTPARSVRSEHMREEEQQIEGDLASQPATESADIEAPASVDVNKPASVDVEKAASSNAPAPPPADAPAAPRAARAANRPQQSRRAGRASRSAVPNPATAQRAVTQGGNTWGTWVSVVTAVLAAAGGFWWYSLASWRNAGT